VKWLRSQMRLVQQEPVLFNDTIYSNIIHGLTGTPHEHSSDDEKMKLVVEACRAANASEFVDQLDEVTLVRYLKKYSLKCSGLSHPCW
jgi:ATP-binding cassette subfamily B (MDR/TAP) protein 1